MDPTTCVADYGVPVGCDYGYGGPDLSGPLDFFHWCETWSVACDYYCAQMEKVCAPVARLCAPLRPYLVPRDNFPNIATIPGLTAHLVAVGLPLLTERLVAAVDRRGGPWRHGLVFLATWSARVGLGSMVAMRAFGPGYVNAPKCEKPPDADAPPADPYAVVVSSSEPAPSFSFFQRRPYIWFLIGTAASAGR